jgi:hypothetical protein
MKQVLVRVGEVKALMQLMHCSKPTVCSALRFRTNTDLAKRIRKVAIDRGGMVTTK